MILFTHAAVGAAAAEFTNSPVAAFALGFASHFILDAIPHWDYKLRSMRLTADGSKYDMEIGRDFAIDFLKITLDALLGIVLGLLFYGVWLTPGDYFVVLCGAAGGLLPDVLQFVYMKLRRSPLRQTAVWWWTALIAIQRFHVRIHTKRRLDGRYIVGALAQASLVASVLAFILFM